MTMNPQPITRPSPRPTKDPAAFHSIPKAYYDDYEDIYKKKRGP